MTRHRAFVMSLMVIRKGKIDGDRWMLNVQCSNDMRSIRVHISDVPRPASPAK